MRIYLAPAFGEVLDHQERQAMNSLWQLAEEVYKKECTSYPTKAVNGGFYL